MKTYIDEQNLARNVIMYRLNAALYLLRSPSMDEHDLMDQARDDFAWCTNMYFYYQHHTVHKLGPFREEVAKALDTLEEKLYANV